MGHRMKVDLSRGGRIVLASLLAVTFLYLVDSDAYGDGGSKDYIAGRPNFHEVDPGKFYRSATLPSWGMADVIQEYGIKTVINLRGSNPGESWYDAQMAVIQRQGINQIDIGMSAFSIPGRKNLLKLLDALKNAPRPILVHCQAGVDRTGEASALYQMMYMGKTRAQAMEMLSPRYGHFETFKPAKDYFVRDVWQDESWARTSFQPCDGQYRFYDRNSAECAGVGRKP